MKWTGNPETDLVLSLMDETGAAILGQVIRDREAGGWRGHEYCSSNGAGKDLGLFASAELAKVAVASHVKGQKLEQAS